MTASQQVIEVIDELCRRFGIVVDWSKDNVFPYVEELIGKIVNYELWTSVVWLVMAIVAGYFIYRLIKWSAKGIKEHDWWDNDLYCVGAIVGAFLAVGAVVVCCQQIFDIVTCITFPEKVLYEFISTMMSQ